MGELLLLGEVALAEDGRGVDLGPARQRLVLAALAVDVNRVVPVGQLAQRVWGVDPPRRARPTLSSYVSRLRQLLPDGMTIARRAGGYVLTAEESDVDLHRFHRLVRDGDLVAALALWRGEPLTGVDGEWALGERERLCRARFSAECDLADARLAQGDDLVAELSARAAEHELDERVAAQYLTALYHAGRAADALEHFRLVRDRLVDELGTEPGRPLQQLHQRILCADPELARQREERVVPRQLPAAPASFTGREPELAELDAVTGGALVISAIAGTGGMGKTWLALHWAHRNLHHFPDGQLFVDLRGFTPGDTPMSSAAAVRGFLDALGVPPERMPDEPHAQASLFRSLVVDRRMLLVLDNARDATQVTPLLPGGTTCTVLVTSRHWLPGLITRHGARHLPLDALPDAEARALLTARLGDRATAEPAAVDELIALCKGFPLALSIIAGRADTQPHLTLADLALELREGLDALDDGDPQASLPAVLNGSYRALTPEQAELLGLLAVAPGPDNGLHAAASLCGQPVARTRTVLRGLEQASLLHRSASGRYRMHDLVRRFAADAVTDPEPALRRVVDFYLHTGLRGDLLMFPGGPKITPPGAPAEGCAPPPLDAGSSVIDWFDAEHQCLLAAQHTAAAHGWHRAAWQIAWSMTIFFERRAHKHDRLSAWQLGLASAVRAGDVEGEATANMLLGHAHTRVGRYEDAVTYHERAIAIASEAGMHALAGRTHRALAASWAHLGDDRKAFEHSLRALRIFRATGLGLLEAHALNDAGWYASQLGELDRARTLCEQALTLFAVHPDQIGEASTLDSLGHVLQRAGDHAKAVDHYQRALALFTAQGHDYMAANTFDRIGQSHAALGQHERAREVWQQALTMYRAQQRGEDVDRMLARLGNELSATG